MGTMKDALLSAKLVSEEDIARVESEKRAEVTAYRVSKRYAGCLQKFPVDVVAEFAEYVAEQESSCLDAVPLEVVTKWAAVAKHEGPMGVRREWAKWLHDVRVTKSV